MLTLTYGYKKPQSGDRGSVFWPALEFDIQRLNDHTHDGANSSKLTSAATLAVTQAVLSAAWVSQGNGLYRQLVTLPGALKYDEIWVGMKATATGHQIFAEIEKVSATTYYVYTNDNTLAYTAVYTS